MRCPVPRARLDLRLQPRAFLVLRRQRCFRLFNWALRASREFVDRRARGAVNTLRLLCRTLFPRHIPSPNCWNIEDMEMLCRKSLRAAATSAVGGSNGDGGVIRPRAAPDLGFQVLRRLFAAG